MADFTQIPIVKEVLNHVVVMACALDANDSMHKDFTCKQKLAMR
jgi:hypothetical protein